MNKDSEDIHLNCKILSSDEIDRLKSQDSRLVTEHKSKELEVKAKKYWDLFYKRNETRFFRDRHWTIREFSELLGENNSNHEKVLFEIGCGVGNFIFPLIEEKVNFRFIACDLSPRAIEFVKSNPLYDCSKIDVFQCDITTEEILKRIPGNSVDVVTLIFVLSAIHPDKFLETLSNIWKLIKPGGLVLFRDYGLFDMAQLRFKAGNKISENFYMRQDGTRSYFFSIEFAQTIFEKAGFTVSMTSYVHRRTVNKKENIDVPRIFVQLKAEKLL
ncbi:hypothetical protein ABEB36_014286 [Hypothenemus hampei]|uniref:tRNA N(3)-methylcytidine methyltransferase n=1 Tax=Hypothenemus hampei TaxID=57062 RepID=A0ABD1E617_HYPHA